MPAVSVFVRSGPFGVPSRAVWLADLHPDRVRAGTAGRFVFVPGSWPDEVDGRVLVEAAGPPGVLRTVQIVGSMCHSARKPRVISGQPNASRATGRNRNDGKL